MGLKERATSIKDKKLMTSFFVGEALDTTLTAVSLNHFNGTEINPFGGQELLQNLEQNEVFILKTGIVAILIGLHALTSIHEPELKIKNIEVKGKYILERALQGGSILTWGVVAWNSVNLAPDLINKIFNG